MAFISTPEPPEQQDVEALAHELLQIITSGLRDGGETEGGLRYLLTGFWCSIC